MGGRVHLQILIATTRRTTDPRLTVTPMITDVALLTDAKEEDEVDAAATAAAANVLDEVTGGRGFFGAMERME